MCESKNMDIELSLLIWEKLTFYYHFNVIDSSPTFSILMLLKFESWYQLSKNSLTQQLVMPEHQNKVSTHIVAHLLNPSVQIHQK